MRVVVVVAAFVAGLLVVGLPARADEGWREWTEPGRAVTMEVPDGWRAGKPVERDGARVVRFTLPDAGEMTLSISGGLRRPGELPASIVKPYFPPDATFEGPSTARGKGWRGLRQEAKSGSGPRERAWLGQFYVFGSTLVALTLGDDPSRIDAQRAAFERIAKSVRYQEPPVDTASRGRDADDDAHAA